jgi:hypothetical protein
VRGGSASKRYGIRRGDTVWVTGGSKPLGVLAR